MDLQIGRLTAELTDNEEEISAELIQVLNRNINPPAKLTADDVYVRVMYIVSDEINSYGGCFPHDEMERLTSLIINAPVLVGHRKDQLPIGRNFHAVLETRNDHQWVKSYFYWLKKTDKASTLKDNIDGGVYKECSIGFTFHIPECSICKADIRNCKHEPQQEYRIGTEQVTCHYKYRQIEKVLETSLVYRGAVKDTSIVRDLSNAGAESLAISESDRPQNIEQLPANQLYVVTPKYDSLDLIIYSSDNGIRFFTSSGKEIKHEDLSKIKEQIKSAPGNFYGQLVGYRGKERCRLNQLMKYLNKVNSNVSRVELKLFPQFNLHQYNFNLNDNCSLVKMLRYEIVSSDKIDKSAQKLMTKEGLRLWQLDQLPPYSTGYFYKPGKVNRTHNQYIYKISPVDKKASLSLFYQGEMFHYSIDDTKLSGISPRLRLFASQLDCQPKQLQNGKNNLSGEIVSLQKINNQLVFTLAGHLKGSFTIKPMFLNGRNQFMIYQISTTPNGNQYVSK